VSEWRVDPLKRDDRRPKIAQWARAIDRTMGACVVEVYGEPVVLEAVDFVRGRHCGQRRRFW